MYDYVVLSNLPKFQAKYTGMTGLATELVMEKERVDRVQVKLPDQVRLLPLKLPKTCVTLKAKGVRQGDKVMLEYLLQEIQQHEGKSIRGTWILSIERR